jgi:hypothetical protein
MNDTSKGFFQTLFDFNFTSFLTLKFLKIIYAVFTILLLVGGLIWFVALASASRGGAGILIPLIMVPVLTLVYLVLVRMSFELIALMFRIGENTSVMAAAFTGTQPAAAGPSAGPAGRPVPPTFRPGGSAGQVPPATQPVTYQPSPSPQGGPAQAGPGTAPQPQPEQRRPESQPPSYGTPDRDS